MKPKLIKIIVFTLLLTLLVLGGGYAGYRGYKSIRQARLVKQAKGYLDKQDLRNAQLCLQRAVRYNNRDLETCRLMARLSEAAGSGPGALVWRGRVVELNPTSLDDRLALAQVAVANNDYTTATNALAGVNEQGKQTAAYHNVAGGVAAAANLPVEAETHFREATRLDPQNALMQLNLATVRLRQTNAPALAEARASLKTLASNPTNSALRCQALRELAVDALRNKQEQVAEALSTRLLQETNSVFRDRLLRLVVLKETKNAQFKPTLTAFEKEAGTNVAALSMLGEWQMSNLGPETALTWLRTLPKETQNKPPAAMLIADCLMAANDWQQLQKALDQQNWDAAEYLRRAFKARALRGQNLAGAAKGEWELALKEAGDKKTSLDPKRSLMRLMNLAAQWKWFSEAEEILWTIVRSYPGEKGAVQVLTQTLYNQGRTRPLMMLYTLEMQRSPKDLAIKNNVAVIALLLEANELKPHDLARDVYQQAPTNAVYASTYAFALHLQSKDVEALKVMQTLAPKALEDPSIAGYYGLVLKGAGNQEKAITYLNWALKGPLLPEEKKLFESAKVRR